MIIKKRNWAFVLYPESAPDNWREILQSSGLQCAVSPLHDRDIDPTGVPKKSHFHVIVCYSGPTSLNVVKSLTDSLHCPAPQALEQIKGYFRYLTHKDNPEKFQYSENDISFINGFNISDFVELSRSEIYKYKNDIVSLCRSLDITEYSDLLEYLQDNDLSVLLEVAFNNTLFLNSYLKSRKFRIKPPAPML